MAVIIRLARQGKINNPFYRVQVIDSRYSVTSGKSLEIVGTYDPSGEKEKFEVKPDKIKFWMGLGAKPTRRVKELLKKYSKPAAEQVGK